ncbi:MAG: hypothetical protein NT062_06925 [Proteobacteria bacterium]|nr:hypothetical protein [Pseudomonadota bacterium]
MHCLAPNSVTLRLDRRGKHFTTCSVCMARTFMPAITSLRGLYVVAPQLAVLVKALGERQLADLDVKVEREMAAMAAG